MVNKKDNTASSVSDSLRNKFFTGASINEEETKTVKKEKVSKNTSSKKSNASSGDVITSSFQIKKNPNRGKTRLNIVLTQDQADKLKRLSKETGYSMSGLLGELIDQIDF